MSPYDVELVRRDYQANGGWETFLSYEDPKQVLLQKLFLCLNLARTLDEFFINSLLIFQLVL